MIKFFYIFVIFIYFCIFSPLVIAGNVYFIENIKVNTIAKNGILAKKKALTIAENKAIIILFDRLLTLNEKKKAISNLNKKIRFLLIKDFSINNEQSGNTQYIAEITIRFKKNQVNQYLTKIGIKYNDIQSNLYLLIPILTIKNKETIIWSGKNYWLEALLSCDLKNNLIPLKIITSSEVSLLATEQEIIDRNRNAIYQLSFISPKNSQIIFAHMILTETNVILQVSGAIKFNFNYAINNNNLINIYKKVSKEFLIRLVSTWRNNNIINKSQLIGIKALVLFKDFNKWIIIRRRLNQINKILEFDTKIITSQGVFIDIKYQGSITSLAYEMKKNNLMLIDLGAYFKIIG